MAEPGDAMTTLDHLRKLVGTGEPTTVDATECGVHVCFFCEIQMEWPKGGGSVQMHAPDCPWVAAKRHVEEWDLAEKTMTVTPVGFNYESTSRDELSERLSRDTADMQPVASENTINEYGQPTDMDESLEVLFRSVNAEADRMRRRANDRSGPRGFTLIELLVVIVIILLVSIVALPTALNSMSHRQVSEAARLLQAQLAGARDAAIRDNRPSGMRFLPDPTLTRYLPNGQLDPNGPLAYNRMVPLAPAPSYSEGVITQWTGPLPAAVASLAYTGPGTPANANPTWGNTTALMAYELATTTTGGVTVPNSPTSWFWNIRIGDKLQFNNAGKWFTVVGPMVVPPGGITIGTQFYANPEMFVNVGPPGTASPTGYDFLLLVNGLDDNKNGWVDEGWDGVDNDAKNGVDDIGEWVETEAW